MKKVESNALITNYFKSNKNTEFFNSPVQCESSSTAFYNSCLKEKTSKEKCTVHCENHKIHLKNVLNAEKEKFSQLTNALATCLSIIDLKNEKITQLTKEQNLEKLSVSIPTNTQKTVFIEQSTPKTVFSKHKNHFSDKDLAKLRSFGQEMKSDSSFILMMMRILYKDDLNSLNGKIHEYYSNV